ncbi:hypothetical protein SDC9_125050 [bioreactor metagenome]|uniref:Uncharacterized protein n=1 Tax=bioreactor metagenome TaxID=1076179 RepID=A0A645CLV9_9ZZZZ
MIVKVGISEGMITPPAFVPVVALGKTTMPLPVVPGRGRLASAEGEGRTSGLVSGVGVISSGGIVGAISQGRPPL